MKIAFIVFNIDGMGGTSRSAITQANALAPHQDVRIVSVTRSGDRPHYDIDPRIPVDYLVDVRDPKKPAAVPEGLVPADAAVALHRQESALVPNRWDKQFTALCDVAMEAALPTLDVDVAVTVTPGLLVAGIDLLPDRVVVVHQEHRSSSGRSRGLEPLLNYAPRADVVAMLTPPLEEWLHDQLGPLCPPTVVMPNPLPLGFHPRSRLDNPLILTAGRLVQEKQFPLLVAAFAEIADQVPDWRLRICGTGPERPELVREIRKWGLWDRVELPGGVSDMAAEWAKASVAALTSRTEGFPLVVQEAMAAGVPVASFDSASGPREIIEHEVNGLLVGPQSVAGMSAALLRMTTDAELRQRLGQGALRTARQYDAGALAERWIGIFSEARARRANHGRLTTARRAGEGVSNARRSYLAAGYSSNESVTPAQARHEALTSAVAAARATGADWLVIPPHEGDTTIVVLPMTARDAFLTALVEAHPPAYLSLRDPALNGWHERRGTIADLGTDLRRGMTTAVCIEPWPVVGDRPSLLGQGCTVEVQFWERSVQGDLVGPRRNPYADRMPAEPGHRRGGGRGRQGPDAAADGDAHRGRGPVPRRRRLHLGRRQRPGLERRARAAAGRRHRHRPEPGVQRPGPVHRARRAALLLPQHPPLRAVGTPDPPGHRRSGPRLAGHRPPDGQPRRPRADPPGRRRCRRSTPTRSRRPCTGSTGWPSTSSTSTTTSCSGGRCARRRCSPRPASSATYFSPMTIGLTDAPDAAPFLKAAWNNRALLQDAFGAVTTRNLAHAPYAHRVSVLQELHERFPEPLAATARSPFRSDTDVSTLSSLAQHYALLTGKAYAAEPSLTFVNLSNADVDRQLARVLDRDQDFICLADHHDHAMSVEQLDALLADFYRDYFPVAAPWEKG